MSNSQGVHRTGNATTDHDLERVMALQAIRVLAMHDALDLADMLFAPLNPTPKGSRL
jgi:hypothetical protein